MRRVALAFVFLALLSGMPMSSLATEHPASHAVKQFQINGQRTAHDTPRTQIVIDVHANTNATWTVRTRYHLKTRNDTRAFRALVADLQRGNATATELSGAGAFKNYATEAQNVTGRSMSIRNVSYSGPVQNQSDPEDDYDKVGILTLTFKWTHFAKKDSGNISVGDAFDSPEGTWFPALSGDQRLVIRTPKSYHITNGFQAQGVSFSIQGNSLVFNGPQRFHRGSISILYAPRRGSRSGDSGLTLTPPKGGSSFPFSRPILAGVGVIAALLAAGVWYVSQRDGPVSIPYASEHEPGDGSDGAMDAPSEEDDFDLSLLSDEERVEYLLERNGGRMRQADIVNESGWSDAKVSQLLSAMAEEGSVNKLRLGRENLISLPDQAPLPDDDELSDDADNEE